MSGGPRVVFCAFGGKAEPWLRALRDAMPSAFVEQWVEGRPIEPSDYAIVWSPPDAFYATQPRLKALFNLGAGVDALLHSSALPAAVPVVRLEDAGMAPLMAEYVVHAAIRHVRAFDRMDSDRRAGRWVPRKPTERSDYPVGVMGAGALGIPVAEALLACGLPVSLWSRSAKTVPGVTSFSGADGLDAFAEATRILVCLLPLTPDTENIIDARLLGRLMPQAYVINVARGRHLVDDDLLAAIADGHVAGATLDVFREEPLPESHPFWGESRIAITAHCSALTQRKATIEQIVAKIAALERGEAVSGLVDRRRGY
ncbi:MAG: glyoxylate/hydroxypyruvate reductase A [Burkholderiaceae bacterium]